MFRSSTATLITESVRTSVQQTAEQAELDSGWDVSK